VGVIAPQSVASELIDQYIDTFQKNYVPPDARETEESNAKFVETGHQRIHYLSIENPESQHRPVILIHGFGGDCNNWMFNLVELGKTLPVFAPDLPGHGASGKGLASGSLVELATAALEFLDALSLSTVDLVGHSLGAAVAMQIAEIAPDRVASLALIAPVGLGEDINNTYIRQFIDGTSRRELKSTLGLLFADKSLVSRDMVNDILKYKRIDGVTEALTQIAASNFPDGKQSNSFRQALASGTSVPTAIVWGDQDEVVDPDHSRGFGEEVKVHMIEGVGHMPHMEAANRVNEILLSHLLLETP
jgi:pyruvate dehydrogenase E2 component (dihydrolipoamide acetyltransferase)